MNKKLILFIIICAFTVILSGCTKYSTNIEITKKDEVIVTQTVLLDLDFYKTLDIDYDPAVPYRSWDRFFNKKTEEKYLNKDYKVRNITDNQHIGKEFQKRFKHAKFFFSNSLPEGYFTSEDSDLPVIIEKSPFGAKYSINLKFVPKRIEVLSKDIYPPLMYADAKNQFKAQNYNNSELTKPSTELTIKIPQKASKHNATSVDSETNTYTWKLSETEEYRNGQDIDIILEYKTTNITSIAVFLFVMIVILIAIIKNKKYGDMKPNETMGAF